jgi:hypothetical protein
VTLYSGTILYQGVLLSVQVSFHCLRIGSSSAILEPKGFEAVAVKTHAVLEAYNHWIMLILSLSNLILTSSSMKRTIIVNGCLATYRPSCSHLPTWLCSRMVTVLCVFFNSSSDAGKYSKPQLRHSASVLPGGELLWNV